MTKSISPAPIAAALLLGAGLLLAIPTVSNPVEAATVCFRGGQVYGKIASGIRQSKAKERARGKWRDAAIRYMGSTRAGNWNSAKYRGYSCTKKGIWYCRAIATPCM